MRKCIFVSALLLAFGPALSAQQTTAPQTISAPLSATPTNMLAGANTRVMIENRARVFGDRVSGGGTRYFAVTDADLAGKTESQVANILSPTLAPSQQVRQVDIVVDLHKPVTLTSTSPAPVTIGTVTASAPENNRPLLIVTNISTSGITVKK
jgi:hypothetical protein